LKTFFYQNNWIQWQKHASCRFYVCNRFGRNLRI
jgi:hypothetical protein